MNAKERDSLIVHMLASLETPSRELTKWESDFIDSVSEWWSDKGFITDKQFEVLERIYAEKTA